MDAKKIADMTVEELQDEAASLSESLFKYRFQRATGQLENPSKIRATRRQIARIRTALRMREIRAKASA